MLEQKLNDDMKDAMRAGDPARLGTIRMFHTPLMDRTRAALGDAGFATEASAGRGLTYEEAMDRAREWLSE